MAVGIIVEYNPFHNGHIRQIKWIKEKFPDEKIIAVMSNKFTQRGDLAVASFAKRAKIAKKYGVDKVLKLPFEETAQAAHIFAYNAVMKLYEKGKIDKLVFGSEIDNVDLMVDIATMLKEKNDEFYEKVRFLQKRDKISFPKASALAIKEISGHSFEMPNDILGFEYIKVIVNNNLPIKVYSIKRNIDFNSLEPQDNYASATLLRSMIYDGLDISQYSPMTFDSIPKHINSYYESFQKKVLSSKDKIKKIPVVSEGIENLLFKNISMPTYELFVEACTSKRYTASRIKRIMAWVIKKM
ncbi:nucleotidyltransferase [Mycoplasmopsis primatum]|uniref:nucleotidyltransferase n=1 Tax=Mycoplasmopsis primatum TaxID=55604 RepID=UPI000496E47D|nr:nucleotidyltransferase [Mycoplasmopsis primatum]